MQPQGRVGNRVVVEKQTGEQQTEQHHQASDQIGHSDIAEHDADKQADVGGREVKQDQHQDEPEELAPGRNQAGHRVHDHAHDDGREQSQGHDIKHHLGGKVGDGMVVSVGPLANEQQSLGREDGQAGERTESKQGQDEEEKAQSVLEALDVVRQSVEEISTQDSEQDGNGVVCQHQHRVPVQVAPGPLRENGKLAEQPNPCIASGISSNNIRTSHEVGIRGSSRTSTVDGMGDLVVDGACHLGVRVMGNQHIQVGLAGSGRWQVVGIIKHGRWHPLCLPRQPQPLRRFRLAIQVLVFLVRLGRRGTVRILPARVELSVLALLEGCPSLIPRPLRRILRAAGIVVDAHIRRTGNRLHRAEAAGRGLGWAARDAQQTRFLVTLSERDTGMHGQVDQVVGNVEARGAAVTRVVKILLAAGERPGVDGAALGQKDQSIE